MKSIILPFLIITSVIMISSCREEVIPADAPATNVNEPVEIRTRNSYTFIINAENINNNIQTNLELDFSRSRIFFSVSDYSGGFVEFVLVGNQSQNIINTIFDQNTLSSSLIDGQVPQIINFGFRDFSGNLKIQISRIF